MSTPRYDHNISNINISNINIHTDLKDDKGRVTVTCNILHNTD